jgi:hypothetical protein
VQLTAGVNSALADKLIFTSPFWLQKNLRKLFSAFANYRKQSIAAVD